MTKVTLILFVVSLTTVASGHMGAWGYRNSRIAISFDGNSEPDNQYKWPTGDPDDWGALAASCAIIAKLELQDRLVHCSYNNFIDAPPGPDQENQLKISADGAIEHWDFDKEVFFDITLQRRRAIADLADEIGKSTPDDPLYFLHAGLSEFVYLAVEEVVKQGNIESLSHVFLVSHSKFNENEKRRSTHRDWNDIQALAENRIQYKKIKDQNGKTDPNRLWNSGSNFAVWYWMRDHPSPDIRWMYARLKAHSGHVADISDCGMVFYLLLGDENGSPEKFRHFIGEGITREDEKGK